MHIFLTFEERTEQPGRELESLPLRPSLPVEAAAPLQSPGTIRVVPFRQFHVLTTRFTVTTFEGEG